MSVTTPVHSTPTRGRRSVWRSAVGAVAAAASAFAIAVGTAACEPAGSSTSGGDARSGADATDPRLADDTLHTWWHDTADAQSGGPVAGEAVRMSTAYDVDVATDDSPDELYDSFT